MDIIKKSTESSDRREKEEDEEEERMEILMAMMKKYRSKLQQQNDGVVKKRKRSSSPSLAWSCGGGWAPAFQLEDFTADIEFKKHVPPKPSCNNYDTVGNVEKPNSPSSPNLKLGL